MPMSRQIIELIFFSKLLSKEVTTAYTAGER